MAIKLKNSKIALLASSAVFVGGLFSTLSAQDAPQDPAPPVTEAPAPETPSTPETPTPEATAPEATTTETAPPDASASDAPATDSADQPTPAEPDQANGADSDTTLPEVEVIQEQPKPQPAQVDTTPEPAPQQADATPAPQIDDGIDPLPADDFVQGEPVEAPPQTESQARASGDFVPISPAGGVIEFSKVPSAAYTASAEDLQRGGQTEPQEALQKNIPGLILNDAAGSTFRTQIEFRGFSTGSVTGFPQGLSVYQNGVRVNEVFGDTVFFDFMPSNAISDITLVTGNPVYGLNAIGGALSVQMKDGFNYQGTEIDASGGSFGRRKIGVQHGTQFGNFAAYAAYERILDDGYRDFSEVDIQRFYGDVGYKTSRFEAHFNLTLADSVAGVVSAAPVELLAIDRALTFTSPQTTEVELVMPQLHAKLKATETLTLSGLVYYRRFKSNVVDGNLLEAGECEEVADDNGIALPGELDEALCSEELEDGQLEALENANGEIIEEDDVGNEPFGVVDRISQEAESWGGTVQGVEKSRLFGLKNQFLAGASYDRGSVLFNTRSEIGTIGRNFVVAGSGITISEPDDFAAREVDVTTEYVGLFFQNVTELTNELTLTVGGRYNYAMVDLVDLNGNFPEITSNHTFEAFNPNVGLTYEVQKGLTVYGSYSEANRAPTPGELACANPENPCPIESFLTDDPPLEQVLSNTWEVGVKGRMRSGDQRLSYGVGYFRTLNQDDILFVSSPTLGLGFFLNAGDTLRQGIEANVKYETSSWAVYANYAYVRATFETANEFSSPSNPASVPCIADPDAACVNVTPGDRIPGIPEHRFKAGFEYNVTEKWTVGADLVAASDQIFLGDEGNDADTLAGYTRVDLNTSYKVSDNIEFYGFVNNVFDREYGLFGTFFEADEASEVVEGGGVAPITEFRDPRTILPAPPVAAYGGVRIKF